MSYIRISNDSFFDKDYNKTFRFQDEYKFFNVSTGISTLVPMYVELIGQVIGEKTNETFQDHALSESETQNIQSIFESEIEKKLAEWEPSKKPPHRDIEYKGKVYPLDLRLTSPEHRIIEDFYTIIQICKECLSEKKTMYLSIE